MELQGTIIAVMNAKSGVSARTGNTWMSQEYVIEVPGQYQKKCVFSIFGEDKIKQFGIQKGAMGIVQFDIDAREYNGRWFNEIRAYNFIHQGYQQPAPQPQQQAPAPSPAPQPQPQPQAAQPFPPPVDSNGNPQNGGGDADDLPF